MKNIRLTSHLVWKTKLPKIKFPDCHDLHSLSIPQIINGKVYAVSFSPGAIFCLTMSGKILWRKDLNYYGGGTIQTSGNDIYFTTSREVLSFSSKTLKTNWTYSLSTEGESCYSGITVDNDRIYFGDRNGFAYCLDRKNGKVIWKLQVAQRGKGQVNARLKIAGNSILTVNTAGSCCLLHKITGKIIWKTKIGVPSVYPPQIFKNSFVLRATEEIILLDVKTGKIKYRIKDHKIGGLHLSGDLIFITDSIRKNPKLADSPEDTFLKAYKDGKLVHSIPISEHCSYLTPTPYADIICIRDIDRIFFYSISKGKVFASIKQRPFQFYFTGPPATKGSRMYFTSMRKYVYCLDMSFLKNIKG